MKSFRRLWYAALALALLWPAGSTVLAQQVPMPVSSGGYGPDLEPSQYLGAFNLSALGDVGSAGVRSNGQSTVCLSNVAFGGPYFRHGCRSPQFNRLPSGGFAQAYFDFGILFTAPPSDMPAVIDPVQSGLKGSGWTFSTTSLIAQFIGGTDKVWASDRTGKELLAFGVKTTADASCTNHTAARDGFMFAGFQLLPVNSCPPTHPPSGWKGAHHAEKDVYLDLVQNDPVFRDGDPFAFWRVPEARQRTDKFAGDFQTYGEMSDHYFEVLPKYGAVVPGGSGAPLYHGWPMGITVRYDAFYFGLPTIGGVTYWQGLVINDSEKVYGVGNGTDYDSLYIGINHNPLMSSQASAQYFDPRRSAMLHNNTSGKCAGRPIPPGSGCATLGFNAGGAAIIALKSPLGDVRYKLFNDAKSEFFNPAHPLAGDTIAINHQHMCGFGGCYPNTTGRSMRAGFGLYSSRGIDMLDGRAAGDLDAVVYHRTFRPERWPERTGEFNKYVPGVHDTKPIWDYNHDGRPDTIYADACGTRGCVGLWSDTLPSGYAMQYGNIAALSIGPFKLAVNDTVPLVLAFVGAPDSAGIEASVNNAIDFYKKFYLGPEAAPAPKIVAVDARPGSDLESGVTLFLDNRTEDWVDPFLATLDVSGDLALNPWLDDSVAARATNNVAAYHIFKSCDNGRSYTSDGDCDGDPVSDPTSKFNGFGWLPFVTIEASATGELPNTFTDNAITAGITYTYVIVTETRGAKFNVVRGAAPNLTAETVEFAPALLGSLSASSTNPNVAVVYVPANLVAGGRRAEFTILARTGASTVPFTVSIVGTASKGGQFRALFVDSVIVTQVETLADGKVVSTRTTVEGRLLRTATVGGAAQRVTIQTFTFSRPGTVTTSGLVQSAPTTAGSERTTIWRGGAGMILLDSADQPLLATTTLTGAAATPGSFIGREDFPFFTVAVNRAQGGTFGGQIFLSAQGDTLAAQVFPSVVWRTGLELALAGTEFGTYEITWADEPFGDGVPFNVRDRTGIQAAVTASLSARAVGSTSSADTELLAIVKAADGSVTLAADSLKSYKLPFSIKNRSFNNRTVTVLVTTHQRTVLLGQGADSIRVNVPEDVWVPGDVLHFVETVTREVRDAAGRTVIGANGQPETETVPVATWRTVLGCVNVRNSCDPTIGGAQLSGYIPIRDGTVQVVTYFVPIRGGDEVRFELRPAVTVADVVASGGPADLSRVHVIPNPYIFASVYERATEERVLKFTNLPPEGRIRIFDLAGRFIQQLDYVPEDLQGGDLSWNLQTREQLDLAYGLYIFVLETPQGQRKLGKFVVIR